MASKLVAKGTDGLQPKGAHDKRLLNVKKTSFDSSTILEHLQTSSTLWRTGDVHYVATWLRFLSRIDKIFLRNNSTNRSNVSWFSQGLGTGILLQESSADSRKPSNSTLPQTTKESAAQLVVRSVPIRSLFKSSSWLGSFGEKCLAKPGSVWVAEH